MGEYAEGDLWSPPHRSKWFYVDQGFDVYRSFGEEILCVWGFLYGGFDIDVARVAVR